MEFVVLEISRSIAVIKIDRPKQLNALNSQVLDELDQAMDEIYKDPSVLAVIITGTGEKAFVAGADIAALNSMKPHEAFEFTRKGQRLFERISNYNKPVIAAIDGYALGGGCELAMACDIRICSEKSKFGQPEVNLGIIPGYGGTQRLPKLIGRSKALQLIITGDTIDAREAYEIGLVDIIANGKPVMQTAMELAEKIASKAPLAVEYAKTAVKSASGNIEKGLDMEAMLFKGCFYTQDQKEGMTAFLEKRRPNFNGKFID